MRDRKRKTAVLLCTVILLSGCLGCAKEKADSEESTLLLATLFENAALSKAVDRFNRENSNVRNVRIKIKNYAENSVDPAEAVNTIKMEIAAGKGPDLVNFGIYFSEGDVAGGILHNLYEDMEKDEDFHQEDCFYHVITSFATGDRLYVMVPDFRITTFATAAPKLKGKKNWKLEEMIKYYEERPAGTILFPGETKTAVFGVLCTGAMDNYVNWDAGSCRFDSEDFQKLLQFADQFPLRLNFAQDTSVRELFAEGKAILLPSSIQNVFETKKAGILLSGEAEFIGYPMEQGNGNIIESSDVVIGIGRNCSDREAAWRFIKSLLAEEYQDEIKDGLPVRRSSLDKMLAEAEKPEYLENGEKKAKTQILLDGEEAIPVYEITQEDARRLITVIEEAKYSTTLDRALYNIVLEEAETFFHGDRTAEETAGIIQNRAAVYIAEKK